jgi:hypothetical protein
LKNVPHDKRLNDKIDIAVIKLKKESITILEKKYDFIEFSEVGINYSIKDSLEYLSVGYPATYSKCNRFKSIFKSKPFYYLTKTAKRDIYEQLECNQSYNIITHYDKKNVVSLKSNVVNMGPDPYGISGSGLWATSVIEKNSVFYIDKKLVGIMTEWPLKNRKYWIGTRIDVVTEIIRKSFNLPILVSNIVSVKLED